MVTGKGLAFRAMKSADQYHIKGIVSYREEDKLFIEAEGNQNQIEQFLQWCFSLKSDEGINEVAFIENRVKNYNRFDISN